MTTILYKIEDEANHLERIVTKKFNKNFLYIEKSVEFCTESDDLHIIYLKLIEKKSYEISRIPLAYFIGHENAMTLAEEVLIIHKLNTVLYRTLKKQI